MAQVTLRINGYNYTLGCKDGEEKHLEAMAAEVNSRIDKVRNMAGPSGEARMLLMAALLMADEMFELRSKLDAGGSRSDPKLGRKLTKIANRADEIIQGLEQPEAAQPDSPA